MAPVPNQYGSISDDKEATLELLPHGPSVNVYDHVSNGDSANAIVVTDSSSKWTRHHCISYLLTAGICAVAARYWHHRAELPLPPAAPVQVNVDTGEGRVPIPPALSTIDPRILHFRSVTREGLASPSAAWGDYLLGRDGPAGGDEKKEEGGGKFVPLPTNEWYLVSAPLFDP